MYVSMSSPLPLSGAADRTGCFSLPLEPILWLADCTWVARYQAYHWSHSGAFTLVNTAECCYVCSYRRAATYFQSVTTGCFWTFSYTVLMLVQVIAGQSANVGVTSRVTVRSFSPELQHGTSEEIKPNRWSRTVAFLRGMCTHTLFSLHPSILKCFFSVVCCS